MLLIVLAASCKSVPKNVDPVQSEQIQSEAAPPEEIVTEPETKEEPVIVEETETIEETPEVTEVTEMADDALLTQKQAMYQELAETLTAARAKRQEIMNARFNDDYADRFDQADAALNTATNSYETGLENVDEAALAVAHSALDGFTSIINDAWLAKAEPLQSTSGAMRQQALNLKADAAVKDKYNFAADLYNKGNIAMHGKDYEAAAGFYQESIPVFMETINTATEKRVKAELALKNAEEKIDKSEKIVEEAVKQLEAGENGEIL
jgi:hypothetical protein